MKKLKKILLVDDDRLSSTVSKFVLEDLDIAEEVVEVDNGRRAIDWLGLDAQSGAATPDLILLDLEMPVMDGLEFIEQLPKKESLARLLDRIVLLTSSVNPYHERTAKAMGVKWFLHRPLSAHNLQPVLAALA